MSFEGFCRVLVDLKIADFCAVILTFTIINFYSITYTSGEQCWTEIKYLKFNLNYGKQNL